MPVWLGFAIILAIPIATIFFMVRIYYISKSSRQMERALIAAGRTPESWEARQVAKVFSDDQAGFRTEPLNPASRSAGFDNERTGARVGSRLKAKKR